MEEEQQQVDLKSSIIKYSIIIALVGIIITTLIYIVDETLMVKWWVGLISIGITLVLLIVFGFNIRNESGGYLTFKKAFVTMFLIVFFSTLISSVYSLLLHTVIDPDLKNRLTEALIEQTTTMLEGFNMPEAQIEEQLDKVREQDNFGVTTQLKNGGIASIVMGLIFGLIVGAIIKKKKAEPDIM